MLIYYNELTLEEGFRVLHQPKEQRLVRGRRVSACSGWSLFKSLEGQPIKCWSCGCEADRWILETDPNDRCVSSDPKQDKSGARQPVLNLYAMRDGQLVMMTRDHIIPKSLGGVDAVANLRPGCALCNGARGNQLTDEELQFRLDHPELISKFRVAKGEAAAQRAALQWRQEQVRRKGLHGK